MNSKSYLKFVVPSVLAVAVIGFGIKTFDADKGSTELDANNSLSKPQSIQRSASSTARKSDFASIEDNRSFVDTVDERLNLASNRYDLSAYDDEEILAAVNDPRVWDFSSEGSPDDLPLDATEREDGRTFFRASPARVSISIPGDVLEVALPGMEEPLLLEVAKIGTPGNGVVSLSGTLLGDSGTFNMTQGSNLVAGHINTSTNTYSFEMFGETGWIHESGALFTGELPPVVDDGHEGHAVHSSLGNQGELIIAKGNSEKEGAAPKPSNESE